MGGLRWAWPRSRWNWQGIRMNKADGQDAGAAGRGVPRGYKQTEAGVIPEDWLVEPIGQAFDICNNLRMPISQAVRDKMAGPFPYYGPTGVQGYINECRVKGTYALIGEDGDHFLKWNQQPMTQLVSGLFNVNNHAHLIRGNKNLTDWFHYYFCHRDLTSHLTRQGASRYKLTKSTLVQLPCALPPTRDEQEKIVQALSDADALIESLAQLFAKKRDLKQGAMQELLTGKNRLPGFSDEWQVKLVGDICQMKSGASITSANIDAFSRFPCYGGNGLRGFTSEQTHDGTFALIGRQGALCGNVIVVSGKFFASEHAIVVTPSGGADVNWLALVLTRMNLNQYAESSAQPGLSVSKLQSFTCVAPSFNEQTAIAAIISAMDTEITTLESKLTKARHLKQGMMQALLTGRIRLI
jgi:type I restriction enzyme S subunit